MTPDTVLLYQDECHFKNQPTLHATWFEKGKQQKIPVYGKHATTSVFGTVDVDTGKVLCLPATTCNAQTFQTFLTYVIQEYPNKHVILVLDNARYHHAIVLKDFLKQQEDNLTLLFLPPYSPNLNLMERVWKVLKERVVANCYHGTELQLIQAIERFVQDVQINTQQILSRIQCVDMSIF